MISLQGGGHLAELVREYHAGNGAAGSDGSGDGTSGTPDEDASEDVGGESGSEPRGDATGLAGGGNGGKAVGQQTTREEQASGAVSWRQRGPDSSPERRSAPAPTPLPLSPILFQIPSSRT